MKFRPCIDIHNGQVKQIVGSSLADAGDAATENFVSAQDAEFFANLYKENNLFGGHIILLNHKDSEYFQATKEQAMKALRAFPMGMQLGGGVNADNAKEFLDLGASHVIVTSYVFSKGEFNKDNLEKIHKTVGKKRLVLDLSCKRKGEDYYVVTDRWQNFTSMKINHETLSYLADYCDEFLVHAADVEGQKGGIDEELVKLLGSWQGIPVTYAGGIASMEDLDKLDRYGQGAMDFTIGSALDLFGGQIPFKDIVKKAGK